MRWGLLISWVASRESVRAVIDAGTDALLPHLRDDPRCRGWDEARLRYQAELCVELGECFAWSTREEAIAAARDVARAMRAFRDRARVNVHIVSHREREPAR